jgi:hypothetical protein
MKHDAQSLEALGKELQYVLTTAKAKLSELQRAVADLNLPEQVPAHPCPQCGLGFSNPKRVVEHLENVHGVREQVKA